MIKRPKTRKVAYVILKNLVDWGKCTVKMQIFEVLLRISSRLGVVSLSDGVTKRLEKYCLFDHEMDLVVVRADTVIISLRLKGCSFSTFSSV